MMDVKKAEIALMITLAFVTTGTEVQVEFKNRSFMCAYFKKTVDHD